MISSFFFIMPMITLSGFGNPISSMPLVLQKLTYIDPVTYAMVVLRGVFLKGVGLEVLWPDIAAMTGLGALLLSVSVLRFHKSLE
jgi:ABC-2 type transport system permease protein